MPTELTADDKITAAKETVKDTQVILKDYVTEVENIIKDNPDKEKELKSSMRNIKMAKMFLNRAINPVQSTKFLPHSLEETPIETPAEAAVIIEEVIKP